MEQSTAFAALGGGVALFTSTNIDDIFLLAAFFADPHLRPRNIVAGQFLGITGLTAARAARRARDSRGVDGAARYRAAAARSPEALGAENEAG
jgi:hypothetical protein